MSQKWLWVKNAYPKWNPGKWNQRLKPAVPGGCILTDTQMTFIVTVTILCPACFQKKHMLSIAPLSGQMFFCHFLFLVVCLKGHIHVHTHIFVYIYMYYMYICTCRVKGPGAFCFDSYVRRLLCLEQFVKGSRVPSHDFCCGVLGVGPLDLGAW